VRLAPDLEGYQTRYFDNEKNAQNAIRTKVDVDGWEVDIFAFVLGAAACFQGVDLAECL
jgi:hypothetical protein